MCFLTLSNKAHCTILNHKIKRNEYLKHGLKDITDKTKCLNLFQNLKKKTIIKANNGTQKCY